jgi:hypothetical protein
MAGIRATIFLPRHSSQQLTWGQVIGDSFTIEQGKLPGVGVEPVDKGSVGGFTAVIKTTKTRPSDTTTYANGDVVNESASAGTVWTFSNVGRVKGGSGIITNALLISSANQSTKPSLELWLFTVAPTSDNDNSNFTPTDAELQYFIGAPIAFLDTNSYVGDATSGAGGNIVIPSASVNLAFDCVDTSRDLYGCLIARNAYVPVSGEQFTVILKVLQD